MIPANLNLKIYRGVAFDELRIICQDTNSNAVNIAGWTAHAKARTHCGGAVVIDLAPNVSNGAAGQITLSHNQANTANFPCGRFGWDLVLTQSNGENVGPFLSGQLLVADTYTREV